MKITKTGTAGTSDSSDVVITVNPNENEGVKVELTGKSVVLKQFSKQMEAAVKQVVSDMGVENVTVNAADNGALDYVIRARVRTAILRAV